MGSYARSLLLEFARQGRASSFSLFTDPRLPDLDKALTDHFAVVPVRGFGGSVAWEQYWFPRAVKHFDLIHGPANASPLFPPCPLVVTLHDAIFMRNLRDISRFTYGRQILGHFYRKSFYPRSARRAAHVITVSEASRQDICTVMNIPSGRITVTGEALPESFRETATTPVTDIRSKFGITGEYFLAMGAYEKRKNIPLLFKALKESANQQDQLVLVGAENLRASGYDHEIKELGLSGRVILLPFVDDADLKGLYAGTTAFLFPTRKEGFGLPILEAMTCGAPVISSDIPASRETAGEAAEFLSPDDSSAWARAMGRALCEKNWKEHMSAKGRSRAEQFTWGPVADKTWAVYSEVSRI
jgi:glycosyltransferase involved in cell wall biosynthesis